jgi:hypothetical protein
VVREAEKVAAKIHGFFRLDHSPFAAEHGRLPNAGGGERLVAGRGRWGQQRDPTRQGRSERLTDLAAATGGTHCLCGTGGLRYLDAGPYDAHGIPAPPFHTPGDDPLWQWARRSGSLRALSKIGSDAPADHLAAPREAHRPGPATRDGRQPAYRRSPGERREMAGLVGSHEPHSPTQDRR